MYYPYYVIGQAVPFQRGPVVANPYVLKNQYLPIQSQPIPAKTGIEQLSSGQQFLIKSAWNNKDAIRALMGFFLNMFEARKFNNIPISFPEQQAYSELEERELQL
jgi:hypothetical protein